MKIMVRVFFVCLLLIVIGASAPPFQAQTSNTNRVLVKSGGGSFDYPGRGKNNWQPTDIDLKGYESGILVIEVMLGNGDCRGTFGIFANTSDLIPEGHAPNLDLKGDEISNERPVILRYAFNKPSKYIFAASGSWYNRDNTSNSYTFKAYVENGRKAGSSTPFALSTNCKPESLPPIPPALDREITKLSNIRSYNERSKTYLLINNQLQKRGIKIGFFGAAFNVTFDFSNDLKGFSQPAQDYLDELSKDLADINAKHAIELLKTGKLEKEDKSGCFTKPEDVDAELVRREQQFAENKFSKLKDSKKIISIINDRIKYWLDSKILNKTSRTIIAINEVRNNKRKVTSEAEFDQGNINDRMNVGKILAAKYRNYKEIN